MVPVIAAIGKVYSYGYLYSAEPDISRNRFLIYAAWSVTRPRAHARVLYNKALCLSNARFRLSRRRAAEKVYHIYHGEMGLHLFQILRSDLLYVD